MAFVIELRPSGLIAFLFACVSCVGTPSQSTSMDGRSAEIHAGASECKDPITKNADGAAAVMRLESSPAASLDRSGAMSFMPPDEDSVVHGHFLSEHFSVRVTVSRLANTVNIHGREQNPSGAAPDLWVRREPLTDLQVQCAGARHGHEFVVLGLDSQTGESVVQRWEWPRWVGGYYSERAASTSPIGVHVRTPDTYVDIQGGQYVSPTLRTPSAVIAKSEIVRFPAAWNVERMVVEPDGRFVLLVAVTLGGGERQILQLPLTQGATPTLIAAQPQTPTLAGPVGVALGDHGRRGRIYAFYSSGSGACMWLEDVDYDGDFDVSDSRGLLGDLFQLYPDRQWLRWW